MNTRALLLFTALVGGCTAAPDVRVASMDMVSQGPTADEFVLQVDLKNPNDTPLVLDLWNYEVTTDAGSWKSSWVASRTLPARSIVTERLPVVIRHGGAANSTAPTTTWRVSGNLRYLLPGQLAKTLFDLGISRPDVAFSASGESTPIGIEAPAVDSH